MGQLVEAAPDRGEVVRARNVWIRTVNAIVAAIELEDEVDPDVASLVLARLRDAEPKAERRSGAKPSPAPTPDEPPAS